MHKRLIIPAAILLAVLLASLQLNNNEPVPSFSQPQDVLIRVAQTGAYTLDANDLRPFGWELARLEPEKIQLWQGDTLIPLAPQDSQLQFYGQVTPTRYDNQATYVLRYGQTPAPVMASRHVGPAQEPLTSSAWATSTHESNLYYLAQVRTADPWLGERLSAPAEQSWTLDTPDSAAGEAQLIITLWAATQSSAPIDHHLTLQLNGEPVGDEQWDGNGPHRIELPLPSGLLRARNQLTITAPGDTDAPADMVYLDKISIRYPRLLKLDDVQLHFSSDASALKIENPQQKAITIWDVSNPVAPVQLTGLNTTAPAFTFGAPAPAQRRHYSLFDADTLLHPDIALAPPALEPLPQGADYIIIAHPSLAQAMRPLAQFRQEQGLRTTLVTTEQIYLKFSAGMQSPQAITDFLRWATQTWPQPAPRFVLLAGDASYDPLDYLDAPNKNLVPTQFVETQVMGETASDTALADLDADGLPDLAIGRFPAQNEAQIKAMVAKTLDYEQNRPAGDWVQKITLVADDDSTAFSNFNDEVITLIDGRFETENLVLTPEHNIRPELLAAFNQGRGLMSYMGHGALDIWGQEEIFSTQDVPQLKQQGRYPIMLVWACLNGYFQHPKRTSLGETLLLSPHSGAIAGMFPTGETFPSDQLVMGRALFGDTLFQQPTMGEALLHAARQLDPQNKGQRDIINTFVLLGDPALRLPFTNTDSF